MRHIVIGTAGHVDHGKTALVKAMTGVETDRLKEEQERELSIDLGFADLPLPSGAHAGIVDVPGHERFIKNMLAGATGIDLVLLVVAADEGVMPQTREHLDIVNLLGVRRGVIVISKTDLVEKDWLEMVHSDVMETVAGSVFEHAPVVPVSSTTGEGINDLIQAIDAATAELETADLSGPFRVPIDRVFRMAGFGLVATGTLTRGTLRVDDSVGILPNKGTARVRQIQVWGQQVESATAGQRVGVNLTRLEKVEVERGDILVQPGSMRPTYLLDARLELTPDAPGPLRNRQRVRIHIGTAEILGRVVLLDAEAVEPAGEALGQLKLEAMTAASQGDRFVIRLYSPTLTIGGGVILDPNPRRHKRYEQSVLDQLALRERGSTGQRVESTALERGPAGASLAELARDLHQDAEQLQGEVRALLEAGRLVALSGSDRLVHADVMQAFTKDVVASLRKFHSDDPLLPAMPKRDLANTLRVSGGEPVLDALLGHLIASAGTTAGSLVVVADAGGYRLPEHEVTLSAEHEALRMRMQSQCRTARFAPPTRQELLASAESRESHTILKMLLDEETLVPVGEFVVHTGVIAEARALIRRHMNEKGSMTVAEFRDLVGTSRKYAVPFLEYLDRIRFTRRVGDDRVLA